MPRGPPSASPTESTGTAPRTNGQIPLPIAWTPRSVWQAVKPEAGIACGHRELQTPFEHAHYQTGNGAHDSEYTHKGITEWTYRVSYSYLFHPASVHREYAPIFLRAANWWMSSSVRLANLDLLPLLHCGNLGYESIRNVRIGFWKIDGDLMDLLILWKRNWRLCRALVNRGLSITLSSFAFGAFSLLLLSLSL